MVDTGTNAGLILMSEDYDRFVWARMKAAQMKGAGAGPVRTGWGVVRLDREEPDTARRIMVSDGGDRLCKLYDAAAARLGLPPGEVRGQAGMALLDSFTAWASERRRGGRVFSIAP